MQLRRCCARGAPRLSRSFPSDIGSSGRFKHSKFCTHQYAVCALDVQASASNAQLGISSFCLYRSYCSGHAEMGFSFAMIEGIWQAVRSALRQKLRRRVSQESGGFSYAVPCKRPRRCNVPPAKPGFEALLKIRKSWEHGGQAGLCRLSSRLSRGRESRSEAKARTEECSVYPAVFVTVSFPLQASANRLQREAAAAMVAQKDTRPSAYGAVQEHGQQNAGSSYQQP